MRIFFLRPSYVGPFFYLQTFHFKFIALLISLFSFGSFTASANPPPECNLVADLGNIQCDDNGTPTEASDDLFTFDLLVGGYEAGATWTASDSYATKGRTGQLKTFGPYLIKEGDLSFKIMVEDRQTCKISLFVAAPEPCSSTCKLAPTLSNIYCEDNGTPTEASDDLFTFDLQVETNSSGFGWFAEDRDNSIGPYNAAVTFGPYPIKEGMRRFMLKDINDPACRVLIQVEAPAACSNDCAIDASVANIVCNDNGTPFKAEDDTYTFELMVEGAERGSKWIAHGLKAGGKFGEVFVAGPYLLGEGDITFSVSDLNGSCYADLIVKAPTSCSGNQRDIASEEGQNIESDNYIFQQSPYTPIWEYPSRLPQTINANANDLPNDDRVFEKPPRAEDFQLNQNQPNPWRNETVISFSLIESGRATILIRDLQGRTLNVISGRYKAGYNEVLIQSDDLKNASGLLFYTLQAGAFTSTRKMTVVR